MLQRFELTEDAETTHSATAAATATQPHNHTPSISSVLGVWWLGGLATGRSQVRLPAVPLPSSDLGPVSYTHLTLPTKRIV